MRKRGNKSHFNIHSYNTITITNKGKKDITVFGRSEQQTIKSGQSHTFNKS